MRKTGCTRIFIWCDDNGCESFALADLTRQNLRKSSATSRHQPAITGPLGGSAFARRARRVCGHQHSWWTLPGGWDEDEWGWALARAASDERSKRSVRA